MNVRSVSVGYPLPKGIDHAARIQRIFHIARELAEWIGPSDNVVLGKLGFDVDACTRVYVEDYAYGSIHRGMDLGELGGAVKVALFQLGHVVVPVNQSTARKYLLGKLPQKDRGSAVAVALKDWGADFPNSDEGDAFVVANYARTEHGLPGLTLG